MKNNLVFVKPINIFTANTSREKEVFIGAFYNRAARLKTIKSISNKRSRLCEERSDEAICNSKRKTKSRLFRFQESRKKRESWSEKRNPKSGTSLPARRTYNVL
jgi:hypothetical protein